MAVKEVRLIGSQRVALALVLVYPALVMLSLALAFGQGTAYADYLGKPGIESLSAAIYLPDAGPTFDRADFLKKISDQNSVRLDFVSSPEAVRQAVALGGKTVGLVVKPPAEKNQAIAVEVLYDNSSVVAGKAVSAQVASAVRGVAYSKSGEILGGIWSDLSKVESDLAGENKKLDEFSSTIGGTRDKLQKISTQFDSIDVSKEAGDLNVFDSFYDDTHAKIDSSKKGLDDTRSLLAGYKKKVFDAGNSTTTQMSELLRMRQNLAQLSNYVGEPLHSQLVQMQNSLVSQANSMNQVSADLQGVLVDIDNTSAKVEQASADLSGTSAELEKVRTAVGGFEGSVTSLQRTVDEGKPAVRDAQASQEGLSGDVDKTASLMSSVLSNVKSFRVYQPKYLVTPVEVTESAAFPVSQLAAVTPIGVAMVLLLTCILLTALSAVLERNAGIAARVAVARVSRLTWLAGKLLGQLVFALLEAGIVLALAVFVFHVPFLANPFELLALLVVIALAFASIGLFVSNFTQTISTAILGSLLAMIPMLFLSGTIFPFEFMPSGVAQFSRLLPLTAAKEALLVLMVKGGNLSLAWPQLALLGTVIVVFVAVSWAKKER